MGRGDGTFLTSRSSTSGMPCSGDAVLVPDLAAWKRERLHRLPETAAIVTLPDWACRILSPSTRGYALTTKRSAYGRLGIAQLWLLDPEARVLEVLEHDGRAWRLVAAHEGGAPVAAPPFDAVTLDPAGLWDGSDADGPAP